MTATRLFDITGRVAIVSGASSGLGRHFALTLARAGAKVGLAARRVDRLTEISEEIASFDGRAIPAELDVTDMESVRACVQAVETELGPIAVLVNNAGTTVSKAALEQGEADWDQVIDTNLKGAWLMAQEVARHMVRLGHGGSIVNVASILGMRGLGRVPGYCASKAGLINLTRALAVEWARHDIRVNALAPGYIETDLNRDFLRSDAGAVLKKSIPQRRFGLPAELEGALLLLASDASRFMTGSIVVIDGGQSASL